MMHHSGRSCQDLSTDPNTCFYTLTSLTVYSPHDYITKVQIWRNTTELRIPFCTNRGRYITHIWTWSSWWSTPPHRPRLSLKKQKTQQSTCITIKSKKQQVKISGYQNYRLMRSDYQNELLFRGSHVHLLSSGPPRPLLSGFPSFSLREIRYNSSADSHALMYCKLNNSV